MTASVVRLTSGTVNRLSRKKVPGSLEHIFPRSWVIENELVNGYGHLWGMPTISALAARTVEQMEFMIREMHRGPEMPSKPAGDDEYWLLHKTMSAYPPDPGALQQAAQLMAEFSEGAFVEEIASGALGALRYVARQAGIRS